MAKNNLKANKPDIKVRKIKWMFKVTDGEIKQDKDRRKEPKWLTRTISTH